MLPSRSIEHIERAVGLVGGGASGSLLDSKSRDEFAHCLSRYDTQTRHLKELTIQDVSAVVEGQGLAALRRDARPDGGVDQPFIDTLDKRDAAARAEAGTPPPPAPDRSAGDAAPSAGSTVGADGDAAAAAASRGQQVPCKNYASMNECPDDMNLTHELLNKLVILRLNGGLGTSMGCKGPKSAIEVRNSLSFLDMAVSQVEYLNAKHLVDVPLLLMNSFNTDEETKRLLSRYEERRVTIRTFRQSSFPLINKGTLRPLAKDKLTPETQGLWYPPGHGDVFTTLARCGLLQQLISMGKEYIFISNIDNLGATVDLNILYDIMENDYKFCMEVTKRERQDVHGGTLVEQEGKPLLLEMSAISKYMADMLRRDKRFDKFNTNNLWVSLRNLQKLVSVKRSLDLPVILREKTARDGNGEEVNCLMFETAAGSAISLFENSCVLVVPRARFLPVKTTDDLFAVQSDLFTVKHGSLRLSEKRTISPPVPTVKLGPNFRTVEEYSKRLPFGVPDLLELEHLTVSGDVHFRNHVVLKGTVIIVAEQGQHIDICSGSVIRDKVITGNLNILPH